MTTCFTKGGAAKMDEKIILSAISLFKHMANFFKYYHMVRSAKSMGQVFYFNELNKHIIIDKDGNGILTHDIKVTVLRPQDFEYIEREIDISDAKPSSVFPKFEEMLQTPTSEAFKRFGLWYASDNGVIQRIENNSDAARNPKVLKFRIVLDTSRLRKNMTFQFIYAVSIPGMFPIQNGRFDEESYQRQDYKEYSSMLTVKHSIRLLRYIIDFDRDIQLYQTPKTSYITETQIKKIQENICCTYENRIFYQRFSAILKNPEYNKKVVVKWDVKAGE